MTKDAVSLIVGVLFVVLAIVGYIAHRFRELKSDINYANKERDRLYSELGDAKSKIEKYKKNAITLDNEAKKDPYIQYLKKELSAALDAKKSLEIELYSLEQKYAHLKESSPPTHEIIYEKQPRDLTYDDYFSVISENIRLKEEFQKKVQEQTEATLNAENRLTALTNGIAQIKNNNFFKDILRGTKILKEFTESNITARNQRILSAIEGHFKILSTSQMSCKIQGKSGAVYNTTFDSCTCPDFTNRKKPCKHMYHFAIEFGLLSTINEEFKKSELAISLGEAISREEETLKEVKQTLKITEKQRVAAEEHQREAKREHDRFKEEKKNLENRIELLNKAISSKLQTFPFLAEILAQSEEFKIDKDVYYLKHKNHPAYESANEIKSRYKRQHRQLISENAAMKNQLIFLEHTFPWLEEFRLLPPEDAYAVANDTIKANTEFEHLSRWISAEEWKKLTTTERYQMVLDRYKDGKRKRSDWEIGRDYERFVGYRYESQGYRVQYFGATQKLEDLGRDVIASNSDVTYIIQCKYWREERTVREKHIFQLYGTLILYRIEHPELKNVQGLFVTSCTLSDTAKQVADYLNIVVKENFHYSNDYPMIKCNISEATGEKIYHLPCDLQYDKVVIEPEKGECYATTVAEAESYGFRRALKWHS